jgi:hypothetical protein
MKIGVYNPFFLCYTIIINDKKERQNVKCKRILRNDAYVV